MSGREDEESEECGEKEEEERTAGTAECVRKTVLALLTVILAYCTLWGLYFGFRDLVTTNTEQAEAEAGEEPLDWPTGEAETELEQEIAMAVVGLGVVAGNLIITSSLLKCFGISFK